MSNKITNQFFFTKLAICLALILVVLNLLFGVFFGYKKALPADFTVVTDNFFIADFDQMPAIDKEALYINFFNNLELANFDFLALDIGNITYNGDLSDQYYQKLSAFTDKKTSFLRHGIAVKMTIDLRETQLQDYSVQNNLLNEVLILGEIIDFDYVIMEIRNIEDLSNLIIFFENLKKKDYQLSRHLVIELSGIQNFSSKDVEAVSSQVGALVVNIDDFPQEEGFLNNLNSRRIILNFLEDLDGVFYLKTDLTRNEVIKIKLINQILRNSRLNKAGLKGIIIENAKINEQLEILDYKNLLFEKYE